MTITRAHRPFGAFLVIATLLVSIVAFSGRASAATEYQIGTFNMAGGHDVHGFTSAGAPDALVASILERQPAFIALQEACRTWVRRVDDALPDYAVAFGPVEVSDGSTAQCKHQSDFGNAIVYRTDFGFDTGPIAHDLQSPAGEKREMLCLAAAARKVVACSTHLTSRGYDSVRIGEAEVARGILATAYPGFTKFLGGDLNAVPLSGPTDRFYHSAYGFGALGEFKEAGSPCGNEMIDQIVVVSDTLTCRDGEFTHDDGAGEEDSPEPRKLDYLFVSPWVDVRSADATSGIHSDHDPLWASVAF
jgi:endonuclease/exonuclease/phosphatase family metal-dependent hydrolase